MSSGIFILIGFRYVVLLPAVELDGHSPFCATTNRISFWLNASHAIRAFFQFIAFRVMEAVTTLRKRVTALPPAGDHSLIPFLGIDMTDKFTLRKMLTPSKVAVRHNDHSPSIISHAMTIRQLSWKAPGPR